jgi:hypothetical protein
MVEFVGAGRGPTTRAERLDLDQAGPPDQVGWSAGRVVAFRERDRNVAIGVHLGPEAEEGTVAIAETILNSLRVEHAGRCGLEHVRWRRSQAIGIPEAGRLVRGVQLPVEGRYFFTWDPMLRRKGNRPWRRWGTDGVVRTTLRIVEAYARAHPNAPRVGIGDFSRRRGGDFGPRHVSHQNGLDVDVYYPRRDRVERPPVRPRQIDGRLAQELVDRFRAVGAVKIFVGPRTRLHGPPHVVQRLSHHDDHLHVRLGAPPRG